MSEQQSHYTFGADTRAVSTQIGYVLAIGIIAILLAGLLSAISGVVSETTEQGTHAELQIIGDRIAAQVMAADRVLLADDGPTTLVSDTDVPRQAGGTGYTLSYEEPNLVLNSTGTDVSISISLQTEHPVEVDTPQAPTWTIYSKGDTIKIGSEEDAPR